MQTLSSCAFVGQRPLGKHLELGWEHILSVLVSCAAFFRNETIGFIGIAVGRLHQSAQRPGASLGFILLNRFNDHRSKTLVLDNHFSWLTKLSRMLRPRIRLFL